MIEALLYALLSGCDLSAVLVPLTVLMMRSAPYLSGAARHRVWSMILVTTVASSCVAFAVSLLRRAIPALTSTTLMSSGVRSSGVPATFLYSIAIACWLVVAIVHLYRIMRRVGKLREVKLCATAVVSEYVLPRNARLLSSAAMGPCAVGYLHPAVLLPRTFAALDVEDGRRIVSHEAAHLRRRDDLSGLLFHLCAAIFWFNPFIHYLGTRLFMESEIACDEQVVAETGNPAAYANLLYVVARAACAEPAHQPAWAGFVHRTGLRMRIERLLRHHSRIQTLPRPASVALLAILLSGVGLVALNSPAISNAEPITWVRVRPAGMHDNAVVNLQTVRDFPPCHVPSRRGTAYSVLRDNCEATTTSSNAAIRKGTLTP